MPVGIITLISGLTSIILLLFTLFIGLAFPGILLPVILFDILNIFCALTAILILLRAIERKKTILAVQCSLFAFVFLMGTVPIPLPLAVKKAVLYLFDLLALAFYPEYLAMNMKSLLHRSSTGDQ